jgi:hypothetical protein
MSNLDLLSTPRVSHSSSLDPLPSWVPDWIVWDGAHPMLEQRCVTMRDFHDFDSDSNAGFDTSSGSARHLIIRHRRLELKGFVFDEIEDIGFVLDLHKDMDFCDNFLAIGPAAALPSIEIAYSSWETVSRCRGGHQYPTDVYLKTISCRARSDTGLLDFLKSTEKLCDLYRRCFRIISRWWEGNRGFRAAFLSWVGIVNMMRRKEYTPSLLSLANHPRRRAAYEISTSGRMMFRTKKGYIGMGPRLAKPKDRIALFVGGRVPLIIRESGDAWELIGDTYVHGIMHGKVFDQARCQEMFIE